MNNISFRVVDKFPEPTFSALVDDAFADYEPSELLTDVANEETASRQGAVNAVQAGDLRIAAFRDDVRRSSVRKARACSTCSIQGLHRRSAELGSTQSWRDGSLSTQDRWATQPSCRGTRRTTTPSSLQNSSSASLHPASNTQRSTAPWFGSPICSVSCDARCTARVRHRSVVRSAVTRSQDQRMLSRSMLLPMACIGISDELHRTKIPMRLLGIQLKLEVKPGNEPK